MAHMGEIGSSGDVERCIGSEFERLVQIVAVVTGSVPAAQDAVLEAFARAWEREAKGTEFVHVAGWVVTVALNLARSGRRRQITERRARTRLASAPRDGPDVAALVDLDRAVAALPRRQRQAVVLHYLLDLDVATVSALLGVSDGTIKTALSRARANLAETLTDREANPA
jgi:RNA polymerase sigma-70 factor, ECF subfamily